METLARAYAFEIEDCIIGAHECEHVADVGALLEIYYVVLSAFCYVRRQINKGSDQFSDIVRALLFVEDKFHVITLVRIRNSSAAEEKPSEIRFLAAL